VRIAKKWTRELKADDGLTHNAQEALFALHGAAVKNGSCDHKFIGDARSVIEDNTTDRVNVKSAIEEAQGSGYLEMRGDIVRLTLP